MKLFKFLLSLSVTVYIVCFVFANSFENEVSTNDLGAAKVRLIHGSVKYQFPSHGFVETSFVEVEPAAEPVKPPHKKDRVPEWVEKIFFTFYP
jgi:hypothetical protein